MDRRNQISGTRTGQQLFEKVSGLHRRAAFRVHVWEWIGFVVCGGGTGGAERRMNAAM